jgi:hypothetical protein
MRNFINSLEIHCQPGKKRSKTKFKKGKKKYGIVREKERE